jgi:hypothetical protein
VSTHHRSQAAGEQYRIRVRGQLDPAWAEWLSGFEVSWDSPRTSALTGRVRDQAELHGLLARLQDLGLPLLEVTCLDAEDREGSDP